MLLKAFEDGGYDNLEKAYKNLSERNIMLDFYGVIHH